MSFKTVEMLIEGPNAFGWFRREKGAHRLVRLIIALYNSNNKRHTTFAGVDVSPILNDDVISDINIPDSDMHGDYHHEIWWSWRSKCEQGQQCRSNKAHSNGN
jgi:protein subunit release factor B